MAESWDSVETSFSALRLEVGMIMKNKDKVMAKISDEISFGFLCCYVVLSTI
jgi:hypothetical protein